MPTTSEQQVLQRIINLSADQRNNIFMKDSVVETAKQILDGIEGDGTKLVVRDVFVKEKFDNADIQSQQEVRNKGQTWGDELRANLDVVDSITGKKVDSVNGIKIATIPKMTDRGTYLINGNEFEFTRQARLKPGVYTKVQNNGEISSFFNVDKAVDFERGFNNNFKISFDPERRAFFMQYGTKNVPLINAMRALGATKDEMQRVWGKDVYDANASAYDKHENRDQNKFYLAVFGKNPDPKATQDQIQQEIKQRLFDTGLDPDVTQITLGKRYSKVDKGAILDASKKVIDIHRGAVEPDDREALIFKSFHDADDHVRERLIKNAEKIRSNIRFKLGKTRQINKSMSTQTFDPFISGTLTTSILANPPSQTNVMSIVGDTTKMTVMGEGGIGSANAVTNDTRQISNSEAGFIDPLHTPEGSNIGIAVHVGVKTVKMGNDLYSQFYNIGGEKQMLRPVDTYNKYVAFPDQYDTSNGNMKAKSGTIKAIHRGKLVDVPKSKVDLVISSPINMFDTSANMIPFLDSIQGNRGLTASKMQEQALPLKFREKPLFKVVDEKGRSISESIASKFGLPKASDDGVIESIDDRSITMKLKSGETKQVPLYKDFSLNAESFISNVPRVSVGDRVVKGQVLADNNFTQDGQVAVGANLRVAYLPYRGYNYEDSAIISESAAKKLTSEHMYDLKARKSSKGVFSREKFRAYYPEEMPAKVAEKLDKDGVIKPGQRVERDDVVIAHLERRTPTADDIAVGRLDKQLKRDMTSHAVKWDHDAVGIVTSVQKYGNNVVVNVKSEEPLKVADKISGLHGNKHIVSKIVPDDQMPFNQATGERIDLTMSPIGVSNRINTSQLLENAAGKIAAKTGKQYEVQNFRDVDNTEKLLEDLEAAGLSDKDVLVDPETNKPFINPVANGVSHIMKLEHRIDHKFSARYREGHDSNEQPASGGPEGAKNLGRMEFAALLARGADTNLKEMFKIKGQRNDEYWRAMETGQSLPPPKNAFVWDKMLAMMAGSGINVEQKGKTFTMKPMTDKDIDSISVGELSKPTETYRKKDLAPINGGLFDPSKAGGIHGDNYTHFKLPEKILNPITEAAAASMLDMSQTKLVDIIDGKQFVDRSTGKLVDPGTSNAFSGGPAVELMLSKVDVDGDLKSLKELAQTTRNSTALNKYNKRIKYLRALKENGLKPTDYMMSKVLVVPSKYRPMFTMGTDGTVIMSDVNELYQQAAHTAESVSELKSSLSEVVKDRDAQDLHLAEVRGQMYQDVKAVTGLREPTAFLHRIKDKKGFISQIDGGKKQSKEGFFQDKVFERRQDLVGRSTIILNPELGGDEIGIPKPMAEKIFRPFVMKKMVSWGYSPLEAQKHIKEKTPIFNRALEVVSDERLVIANRAPTLHRWNMTAFKPKLTDGKSIEVPSVVINRNFGGDFDGDTFQIHTPISPKALKEAEAMKPSSSMLKTGYDSVLNAPAMDMVVGSWLASTGKGGSDTNLKFDSVEDARKALKIGTINYADRVTIDGRKAPLAMHDINESVPDDMKRWDIALDDKGVSGWIKDVTKSHSGKLGLQLADKIKQVGNNYVTAFGFTLGLSDTVADKDIRNKVLKEAEKKVKPGDDMSVIKAYAEAKSVGEKMLVEKHGDKTMLGIGVKSGGGKGIGNTAAITLMPGIVMDAQDRPIPMPITKSYSEGLDTFGYWAAAHGARGGNIKKSISSSKPGWMTKDLVNSIYETRIATEEPMDTDGVEYDIEDRKAIANRYLAQDVKDTGGKIVGKRGDLIDSDLVNKMMSRKILKVFVQSPISDPSPGDGFSSWSYGADYDGKRHNRGDHIGIISSHTITEPSVNMAMKSFHTGGAFEIAKRSTGTYFDALDRTLRFTQNLPDKGALSSVDGTVKSIKQSSIGGYDVVVKSGDVEETRYVQPGNSVAVKEGQKVSKGDQLDDGIPSPHDMLKYRGMRDAQKFLVKRIDTITDNKLDRRDIETIVRGITNTTKVMKPGSSNYIPGDVAPLSTIEWYNKNNRREEDVENTTGDHFAVDQFGYKQGVKITNTIAKDLRKKGVKRLDVFKDRIKHEPFLTPAGIGAKTATGEDWIARLAHNRIKQVLEEGTTQGWKSIASDTGHPIPQYITGEYTW